MRKKRACRSGGVPNTQYPIPSIQYPITQCKCKPCTQHPKKQKEKGTGQPYQAPALRYSYKDEQNRKQRATTLYGYKTDPLGKEKEDRMSKHTKEQKCRTLDKREKPGQKHHLHPDK
jgi:hypothetical protein